MRLILLFVCSLSYFSIAQKSINYQGKALKVYPFEQEKKVSTYFYSKEKDGKMKRSERPVYRWSQTFRRNEVFLPLGQLDDGEYLQLAKVDLTYYEDFKWEKVQHFNYKIPFAILNVKNNKLNGPAYFLSVNGDTVVTGFYKDNLAEGRWRFDKNEKNFTTYKNDQPNGPYFRVSSEKVKRKKVIATRYESGNYSNGAYLNYFEVDSSERGYITKEMHTIDSLQRIKVYTNTRNGVVISKGNKKEYQGIGEWNYFYNNGAKKSTLNYSEDTIYADRKIREWVDGLAAHPYYFNSIEFNGIKILDKRRYGGYQQNMKLYVSSWYSQTFKSVECFGEETFYHLNGSEQFSYKVEGDEIIMDTVFSDNGAPFFFLKEDDKTKEFVLEYFDYNGKKIDEQRVPFEKNPERAYFKLMYKGLALYSEQLIDLHPGYQSKKIKANPFTDYYYDERPTYEQALAGGDTTFYTYLRHNGNELLHEIYYIFGERVRIEKQYSNNIYQSKNSPILIERRDYFNDDFTECHTILTSVFDEKYKVLEEFDIGYESNFYQNEQYHNEQRQNQQRRNLQDYNVDFFPTSKNHIRLGNYRDPAVKVSNYKVAYTMDGTSFTGQVDIRFDVRKQKLKFNEDELKLKFYSIYGEYSRGAYLSEDRFGLEYQFSGLNVIPDFALQMPSGSHYIFKSLEHIKGSLINGKKEGEWVFKNSYGKTIIEATFKNDKLDGELKTYYYQKKRKNNNHYNWYSNGTIEEQYYLDARSKFENGQIISYEAFNLSGDPIAVYEYKDGEPIKGWYLQNQQHWLEDVYSDSIYMEMSNNELTKLDIVNFAKDNKISTYNFKNDEFDGLYVNELDSGYWENGKYTGIYANNMGYDRIKKQYIKDGLMYKLEIRSPENYKLLQLTYDTSTVRLSGSAHKRFYLSDHIKFHTSDSTLSDLGMPLEAHFTSYYDNQQIHAEGVLANGVETDKKGTWKYYNPDGGLVSEIMYLNYAEQPADEDDQFNYGTLTQFENGFPIYKARITKVFEKYNCASADNYEIRQLRILEDYNKGDTIKNPTRYHKNYYDMGVLQAEGEIINGLAQGIWKFYDREGGLSEVGMYLNGKRTGRWLKGDLTGLGFIGDFCLATDNYEINANQLKKNVRLEIVNYLKGNVMSKTEMNASRND